jgi:hypothetical protein
MLDAGRNGGKHALALQPLGKTRGPDILEHIGVQASEPEGHTVLGKTSLAFHQHLERRVLDIENSAQIQQENAGPRLGYMANAPALPLPINASP